MVRKAAASSKNKKSAKKSSSVKVNFKGVEVRKTCAEDDYLVKVAEVSKEEGDKAEYLRWVFEVIKGAETGKKYAGQKLYYNTSLSENSLWNLRGLLEAMGEEVPDGIMNIDLSDTEGKKLGVTAEHETYEGKARASIVDYFPEEDFGKSTKDDDDEDGDDEEGSDSDEDEETESEDEEESEEGDDEEEEASDEVSEDDILKMDEDELSELVESAEIDVDLSEFKTIKKKRQAVIDALAAAQEDGDEEEEEESEDEEEEDSEEEGDDDSDEEEDEEEEDEEDEEGDDELTEEAINAMGTKELQALLKEHKVKCNLSGTTKAKRRAVIKAMKAAKKL